MFDRVGSIQILDSWYQNDNLREKWIVSFLFSSLSLEHLLKFFIRENSQLYGLDIRRCGAQKVQWSLRKWAAWPGLHVRLFITMVKELITVWRMPHPSLGHVRNWFYVHSSDEIRFKAFYYPVDKQWLVKDHYMTICFVFVYVTS